MFKRMLFTVLLLLPATQLVLAHDTWIEKRDGDLLVLRGHGGAIEAYDPALVKEAKALDAKGQAVEMEIVKNKDNASLSAKANPAIVGALYDSGYWLKTTDGWKKATKTEGKGKYQIVESIKSKQWCKSVLGETSESSKPIGQRFEVVPQKDPTTVRVGDKLSMKVTFDGKPVEGAIITTGGGHASDAKDALKTDKDGMASVTIQKSGAQMVKASHSVSIKDDPDADMLYLASTITFDTHEHSDEESSLYGGEGLHSPTLITRGRRPKEWRPLSLI
jgi:nickel transport protein